MRCVGDEKRKGVEMPGKHELGSYRGFRLYAVDDEDDRVRGFAVRRDDSDSEEAFTVAGASAGEVVKRLRMIVDGDVVARGARQTVEKRSLYRGWELEVEPVGDCFVGYARRPGARPSHAVRRDTAEEAAAELRGIVDDEQREASSGWSLRAPLWLRAND
jgi:hypothetical protein